MASKESWKPTPYSHDSVIPKSRTGSGELKDNDTRSWSGAQSSREFPVVIDKSGYEGMGDPSGVSKAEVETPYTYWKVIDKSMPAVPVEPKSWKKKGYSMELPITLKGE